MRSLLFIASLAWALVFGLVCPVDVGAQTLTCADLARLVRDNPKATRGLAHYQGFAALKNRADETSAQMLASIDSDRLVPSLEGMYAHPETPGYQWALEEMSASTEKARAGASIFRASGKARTLKSGVGPDEDVVLDYAWLEYEIDPPGGFRADALTVAGDLVEGKANDWSGAMFQSVGAARVALLQDLPQIRRFLDDRAPSQGRVILVLDKQMTPIVKDAFVEVFKELLANPRFRYIDGNP